MPTDLGTPSARKREAQAQTQDKITVLLAFIIVCLGMFLLLFEVLVRSS
jgi:hypothetical protein